MKILIENSDVKIIYTKEQDLSFILKAERENSEFVGQWTIEQHEKALDDEDILHLLIKETDGKNIGYIIIKGLTNQNDSVELMRIVITEKIKVMVKLLFL